jgi:adenylylsulfate kinase
MGKHISWHASKISKTDRHQLNQHKSAVLWFTGLSGSGKSTISVELEKELFQLGIHVYRLDGDNLRHGLNANLGFSPADRKENIRRIGEVAKLMVDAGLLTLAATISPFREDREQIRKLFDEGEFIEVFVKARVEVCKARDPKGLYRKAEMGKIKNFTGIDAPYEEPKSPEIVIDTEKLTITESVQVILDYLKQNGYLQYP